VADPEDSLVESIGAEAAIESWERLAARERVGTRERVAIDAELEAVAVAVVGVGAEAFKRARLAARVVGPEEEEGADEVASARFRLRVSIQKPKPLKAGNHLAG